MNILYSEIAQRQLIITSYLKSNYAFKKTRDLFLEIHQINNPHPNFTQFKEHKKTEYYKYSSAFCIVLSCLPCSYKKIC